MEKMVYIWYLTLIVIPRGHIYIFHQGDSQVIICERMDEMKY